MEAIIKSPNYFDFISSTFSKAEKLSQGCNRLKIGKKEGSLSRVNPPGYHRISTDNQKKTPYLSWAVKNTLFRFSWKLAFVHKSSGRFWKSVKICCWDFTVIIMKPKGKDELICKVRIKCHCVPSSLTSFSLIADL